MKTMPSPQEITKRFGAKSNVSGLFHLPSTWAGILLAILGAAYLNVWPAFAVAALLLVGLQHRLFTLYEAIHGCLVRNAAVGDVLARFLAA